MPRPARLARVTATASARRVDAPHRDGPRPAPRRSTAPIAPLPDPRSTTTGRRSSPPRHRRVGEAPVELPQGVLDDLLGLRAGDQHPPVDEQVERAERPVAEDVLQRLPRQPAGDHGVEPGHPRSVASVPRPAVSSAPSSPDASSTIQRASRVASSAAKPPATSRPTVSASRSRQATVPSRSSTPDAHQAPSVSRRVCSSWTRASLTSSSSPASTLSSLWTVRPMRWSLTRFSLKL